MTPQDQWTAVDRYLTDLLIGPDEALDHSPAWLIELTTRLKTDWY